MGMRYVSLGHMTCDLDLLHGFEGCLVQRWSLVRNPVDMASRSMVVVHVPLCVWQCLYVVEL